MSQIDLLTAPSLPESSDHDQTGSPAKVPSAVCCIQCRRPLQWSITEGRCAQCGAVATCHDERLADFVRDGNEEADTVWQWPAALTRRLAVSLDALRAGTELTAPQSAELQEHGLYANGALTSLGQNVSYHVSEYRVQGKAEQFVPAPFLDSLQATSRVLDVGCGAGQTLRRLQPFPAAEHIGLDCDLTALAVGCRIVEDENQAIAFVRSAGDVLPFPDRYFSHVLCRVALNFMHQRRAVREMVRVLQPGGMLYLHVEGPGADLRLMRRRPLSLPGLLRNFALGCVLALTGFQATLGRRWSGGRAFGSRWRLSRFLRQADCAVLQSDVQSRYAFLPFSFRLLAKRR
jgi:SAM-dependent methyltransferase